LRDKLIDYLSSYLNRQNELMAKSMNAENIEEIIEEIVKIYSKKLKSA
jgi:uncharacterized protein (DUF2164 family)